jgi:SAM-dependent methyltransferase
LRSPLPRPAAAPVRRALRSIQLRAADAADRVSGRRDALVPPRRMWFVGDSDFVSTGDEFLRHFQQLAGLSPHDRVLDLGCGIGRMARVLVDVLEPPGSYDGFDVVPHGIDWCRAHYVNTRAPFRFELADVRNAEYNPDGRVAPQHFRFPYADASFDLVLATSLFTHLLSDNADRYLAETARVLAPGGRSLSTWFLLDAGRPPRAQAAFEFAHPVGRARVIDPRQPEKAVAHREGWLHARLAAHGLRLRGPVLYGTWAGHAGASLQDIVVAERPAR